MRLEGMPRLMPSLLMLLILLQQACALVLPGRSWRPRIRSKEARALGVFCADDMVIPTYSGPSCGSNLSNVVARIELEESGIAIEVADSLVADGGRGLFVSLMEGVESVTLDACTAFCGYATGAMYQEADSACGKTVAFHLRGPETAVFFEGELCTVRMLLDGDKNIEHIAGHKAVRDATTGDLIGIEPDSAYDGPRYFIPESPAPLPLGIMNIGQFANDLAIGADAAGSEAYESRSEQTNLLVLVQRLERDPSSPNGGVLRPSRPISTLSRDITFENAEPMEIGCEYGARYWTEKERTSTSI